LGVSAFNLQHSAFSIQHSDFPVPLPSDPIEFLFSLERLGMKFGLENIRTLCAALDHPERAFRAIIVAGTNGKGSVTVMVETALRAAGYRTARYTSPHLVRLEERFVIDGREVETAVLRDAASRVQTAVESLLREGALDATPTFFECTTAAAFELFRRAGVDIAVLEVGLGGRLDATNVVTPIAAAITSIDFDHQEQLGDSLASIAREKAGVIKAGVPVICGPLAPEAERVVREACDERGALMIRADDDVRVTVRGPVVDVRTPARALDNLTLALKGAHQRHNAAVAVALVDELSRTGIPVSDDAVREGLTRAEWPARLEQFSVRGTEFLLDAAHNPAGARALAAYLADAGWYDVTLVFGAMRDKDVRGMLETLVPSCGAIVCTTAPSPRALSAAELAATAEEVAQGRTRVTAVSDPEAALDEARRRGRPVVAAGSIFLIGPLRDILR
jgi:dihydrofolate synthase/folylpolyglutamate synthase